MLRLISAFLLAACIPASALGQIDPYQEMAALRTTSRLYFEAFALPGGSDGPLLTIAFRIPNDRLVFMRHAEGLDDRLFRASVSATVEVHQDDRIVDEEVWKSESFATHYDDTVDPTKSTEGSVSMNVAPGRYGIRLRLNDLNTERVASTPMRSVVVPAFDETSVGQAILVDTLVVTEGAGYFSAVNLGGDARFGDDATALVPISLKGTEAQNGATVRWSLRKLDSDAVRKEMRERRRQMQSYRRSDRDLDEPPRTEEPLSMEGGSVVDSGSVASTEFVAIGAVKSPDVHGARVTLAEAGDTPGWYLAPIDLEGRNLENGAYVLDVKLDGASEPAYSNTPFTSHWPGMPVSLLDIDIAIKNMRFILSRQEVDRLKTGSREDKIRNFRTFWSERDPTPETAYNELMVEYFRRVDYAAVEYRTGPGMIPNGLETDRAKIYIVHGPPDDVSRSFPEAGGVLETWVYSDGKTFTFEAASSIDAFHMVKEG